MAAWIPTPLAMAVARALGLTKLNDRLERLEQRVGELQSIVATLDPDARHIESSKSRWRDTSPTKALTWGRELSGDPFVRKLLEHCPFSNTTVVVELGPGYGRLLSALQKSNAPFARYTGVDISQRNVAHLSAKFATDRIGFQHADVETCRLAAPFDVFISSLTMKHLFPTFEAALRNLSQQAKPGAMYCFDLIEGDQPSLFERDQVTYVKEYTQQEVGELLERIGIQPLGFDSVEHEPGRSRMLVIARQSDTRPSENGSGRPPESRDVTTATQEI